MTYRFKLYDALRQYEWSDISAHIVCKNPRPAKIYEQCYYSLKTKLPTITPDITFEVWRYEQEDHLNISYAVRHKGSKRSYSGMRIRYSDNYSEAEALARTIVFIANELGIDWNSEIHSKLIGKLKQINNPPLFSYVPSSEAKSKRDQYNQYGLTYWTQGVGAEAITDKNILEYLCQNPNCKVITLHSNPYSKRPRVDTIISSIEERIKQRASIRYYNKLFVRFTSSSECEVTMQEIGSVLEMLASKSGGKNYIHWNTEERSSYGIVLKVDIWAVK